MSAMDWSNVISSQDNASFEKDYYRVALASEPPKLPERTMKLGNVEAGWFPTTPGVAHIFASGGTPLDRLYACQIVEAQLEGHGIKRVQYSLDWDHSDTQLVKEMDESLSKLAGAHYASWADIEAKAKRLIQTGKVHILRNSAQYIAGHVSGDHGDYECEIQRLDPNSKAISLWSCTCLWDQFAWQRTRQFKRFEGRPCAHILAMFWLSQSLPLDEENEPGAEGPQEPQGGAGAIPATVQEGAPQPTPGMAQVPGGGTGMVPPAGTPGPQQQGMQNQQAPMPPPTGPVPGQAPEPPSLIPQYPQDPALQPAINPVSVPGQKPQSPLNPIQNPGGTFSSVHIAANSLVESLLSLRPQMAQAAQKVYDEWQPTEEGDEEFGGGGICDEINRVIEDVIVMSIHCNLEEGGQPGEDHAYTIARTRTEAAAIDIPAREYESGGGYSWQKILGVRFVPEMINIVPLNMRDLDFDENMETFSHVAAQQFQNGQMVQLKQEDVGTTVGLNGGQTKTVPMNSIGEVLGVDPITGMINTYYAGPQSEAGPLQPHGITAWHFPGDVIPRPDLRKPGPAIRRRT